MTERRDPGRLRTLLFRVTLLGYPLAFRRAWGEELVRTFEEAWRVRSDFLPTLRTRLVAGRNFTADETAETPVAIIDRDLARFLWGDGHAVGRRFRIDADAPWLTVVGVVDELIMGGPDNSMGEYALLRPASQNLASTVFAIRARGPAAQMIARVRTAVREVDPNQPVWKLSTARAAVADEVSAQRFFMLLMVTLGVVSLALAALGLYSLLAFTVSRRVHELGIRMALGARSGRVVGSIVIHDVSLALLGVLAGLAGALATARLIESLLFDVSPRDPAALGTAAAFMIVVAALASAIPAMRAARVDPMCVLRAD